MLSQHLELHERTRIQGAADALIWSSAAAASLGSGFIMAAAGYTALGILSVGAVVLIAAVMTGHRRSLPHAHDSAPATAAGESDLPLT